MKPTSLLEELMESFGAQGADASEFISKSRVLYRVRPSKMLPTQRDMLIGFGKKRIQYYRMDVGQLLKGTPVIQYDPKDLPSAIVLRFIGLRTMGDLKVSNLKYDKKRRLHFFTVSAPRNSDIFRGGGRQYVKVESYAIEMSITDLSSVMDLPV